MVSKKIKKGQPYFQFDRFIAWPIAGLILLIVAILNFNKWQPTVSIVAILIALFVIIWGGWFIRNAWKRM